MLTWTRPLEGEYIPYQLNYINRVPDGDLIEILKSTMNDTEDFLLSIPADKLEYRYAKGKWNIKQVVQHLIDTERIMTYRALTFARNDKTELPGFEENDYAAEANTDERKIEDLITEYKAVRHASILLFSSMNDALLNRTGIANRGQVKVKTYAYIIAGHELHHEAIIRERYLGEVEGKK